MDEQTCLQATEDLNLRPYFGNETIDRKRRIGLGNYLCSVIPQQYWFARTDQPDVLAWFAAPQRTLLLLGNVGTGKSHAAYAGIRQYLADEHNGVLPRAHDGITVRGGPVVELLDAFRGHGEDEGEIAEIEARRAELLLLDDLGAARLTDWAAERLYGLVNHRWANNRPMIVCSNVVPSRLSELIDPRIVSRLADGAVVVPMTGPDRRFG